MRPTNTALRTRRSLVSPYLLYGVLFALSAAITFRLLGFTAGLILPVVLGIVLLLALVLVFQLPRAQAVRARLTQIRGLRVILNPHSSFWYTLIWVVFALIAIGVTLLAVLYPSQPFLPFIPITWALLFLYLSWQAWYYEPSLLDVPSSPAVMTIGQDSVPPIYVQTNAAERAGIIYRTAANGHVPRLVYHARLLLKFLAVTLLGSTATFVFAHADAQTAHNHFTSLASHFSTLLKRSEIIEEAISSVEKSLGAEAGALRGTIDGISLQLTNTTEELKNAHARNLELSGRIVALGLKNRDLAAENLILSRSIEEKTASIHALQQRVAQRSEMLHEVTHNLIVRSTTAIVPMPSVAVGNETISPPSVEQLKQSDVVSDRAQGVFLAGYLNGTVDGWGEAITALSAIVAHHAEQADIISLLATARLWYGDPHGAVDDYKRALSVDGHHLPSLVGMASAAVASYPPEWDMLEDLLGTLQSTLRATDAASVDRAEVLTSIARIWIALGYPERALHPLELAGRILQARRPVDDPSHVDNLVELARAYHMLGQYSKSRTLLADAGPVLSGLAPNSHSAVDHLLMSITLQMTLEEYDSAADGLLAASTYSLQPRSFDELRNLCFELAVRLDGPGVIFDPAKYGQHVHTRRLLEIAARGPNGFAPVHLSSKEFWTTEVQRDDPAIYPEHHPERVKMHGRRSINFAAAGDTSNARNEAREAMRLAIARFGDNNSVVFMTRILVLWYHDPQLDKDLRREVLSKVKSTIASGEDHRNTWVMVGCMHLAMEETRQGQHDEASEYVDIGLGLPSESESFTARVHRTFLRMLRAERDADAASLLDAYRALDMFLDTILYMGHRDATADIMAAFAIALMQLGEMEAAEEILQRMSSGEQLVYAGHQAWLRATHIVAAKGDIERAQSFIREAAGTLSASTGVPDEERSVAAMNVGLAMLALGLAAEAVTFLEREDEAGYMPAFDMSTFDSVFATALRQCGQVKQAVGRSARILDRKATTEKERLQCIAFITSCHLEMKDAASAGNWMNELLEALSSSWPELTAAEARRFAEQLSRIAVDAYMLDQRDVATALVQHVVDCVERHSDAFDEDWLQHARDWAKQFGRSGR